MNRAEMETQIRRLFGFGTHDELNEMSLWNLKLRYALERCSRLSDNPVGITRRDVETGNTYTYERGYVDKHGKTYSNYHYEDLNELFELYQESSLKNPGVIIDTNHANSGKHYLEQIRIAKEVMHSCHLSKDIRGLVKGLMIESYIEDGNQPVGGGCYGKSITDPCLGWEKSERLIYEIADLL